MSLLADLILKLLSMAGLFCAAGRCLMQFKEEHTVTSAAGACPVATMVTAGEVWERLILENPQVLSSLERTA